MHKQKSILLLSLLLWVCSCVEPFEINIQNSLEVVTVDATLTDENVRQEIKISKTVNAKRDVYTLPYENLKVEILVNGKERVQLTDLKNGGRYALPDLFRTKVGDTYKLLFQKADGTKYESNEEKMNSLPPIDKIYDEFELKGEKIGDFENPAHYVYIDFQDPASEQNNYLWTWSHWERQSICYSADDYDYQCSSQCWEILHSETLNVFSDIYSNGKPIVGKLIAIIPYYATSGCLIEIKQQAASPEAFRYLKLLYEQISNTGTLVDTPPGLIVGNIKNLNTPSEPIAGFFMATSTRTTRYWLSRENAREKARPIGLLRRNPRLAPEPVPPLYPCVSGPNRTPTKPKGWVD